MRDPTRYLNEDHRYFPEWADLPGKRGPLVEADHNSYLSGGYSEEFGYYVSADRPPVFAPLDGDPDDSRLWYVQITGLHPGYPECGRPHDRNPLRRGEAMEGARRVGRGSGAAPRKSMRPIRVIRVGERTRRTASHDGLATRLTSLWTRWRDAHRRPDH